MSLAQAIGQLAYVEARLQDGWMVQHYNSDRGTLTLYQPGGRKACLADVAPETYAFLINFNGDYTYAHEGLLAR